MFLYVGGRNLYGERTKSTYRRVSVASVWRLFAPAAVLGLLAIGAGNGAQATGAGTNGTPLAVVEQAGRFVLVDEQGRTIARSDVVPTVSVAGAVVTAVKRGPSYGVELRPVASAPSRVVARAAGPQEPGFAFSDDGTTLAIASRRAIQIVAVRAETTRTLRIGPGTYSAPALSPDGRLLAFVRTTGNGRAGKLRSDLEVVPVAGGRAVTVFRVPHPYSSQPHPRFTPDGTRVAFVVDDTQLVTVPVLGGRLEPVTPKLSNATIGNVIALPDGSGYIVSRKPRYGVPDVWQVDVNGAEKRLTRSPIPPRGVPRYGTVPLALAPDGTRLLIRRGTELATYSFHEHRIASIGMFRLPVLWGYWPAAATPAAAIPPAATPPTATPAVATSGNGFSGWPALSVDGGSIAFVSAASNLVGGDDNGLDDVFVRDLVSQTTERVSVSSAGQGSNGTSDFTPAISADGRYVAFVSRGTNLVAGGDANGDDRDVFLRDRASGTTRLVSLDSQGRQADNDSFGVAISPEGGSIAFGNASALVPADTNGNWDVYVRDDGTGTTVPVDVGADGRPVGGRLVYTHEAIGNVGRFVAFVSDSSNLVPGDTNGVADVFVLDRARQTIERVSVASGGAQANGDSGLFTPAITPDGRFVAFASTASNLVPGDTNGTWDVFLRDRLRGTTERISIGGDGEQANGGSSGAPALSADGRFVAFGSFASNLVPGDTNGAADVFVRDRANGTTERVSVATGGGQADGGGGDPTISADGRYVAFDSSASNLVAGDANGATDVFVHDRQTGTTTLVSVAGAEPGRGSG